MELGKKIELYVVKKTPIGLFLNEDPEELLNSVTLPKEDFKLVSEDRELELGDVLEAYCYKNSKGQLAVTLTPPIVANGEVGILECVEANQIGAFLRWGFEKDVLLPFNEQLFEVKKGHKVMVGIYTDKTGRPCATQKLKKFLRCDSPYNEGDTVSGIIYDMKEDMGAFVAVAGCYYGLILSNEVMPNMAVGQQVTGRVVKVREDGKLNITVSKRIDFQMDEDSEAILEKLVSNDGYLPYHDKTDADTIRRVFNISKKAFKRSIGKLYKEGKIELKDEGIHLINQEEKLND